MKILVFSDVSDGMEEDGFQAVSARERIIKRLFCFFRYRFTELDVKPQLCPTKVSFIGKSASLFTKKRSLLH